MSQQRPFEEGRFLTAEEVATIEARKQAAIQAAQRTPGTRTKHLRLSIDFHITIAGTPPDDDGLNEPDPIYHARQARLLAAVRSSPAVLKQWMHELIASQMRQKGWSDWDTLTGGDVALQDMLAPALKALSEEDQAYFAEGAREGYFEDYVDLFLSSFTITEEPAVVVVVDAEDEEEAEQPVRSYSIEVRPTNGQFQATVLELDVTVTGATWEEALTEAQRAIVIGRIEEVRARTERAGGEA